MAGNFSGRERKQNHSHLARDLEPAPQPEQLGPRCGADDERGTLNLITPAKRLQPNSLVREGLVASCARTISYGAFGDG